jgi:hypothetical protein
MTRLVQIAVELQRFLDSKSWPNCVIGGLAVQRWGEPRLTEDVDLTLLTGFGGEEMFIDALLERYRGRPEAAREFALEHRVLLLQTSDGVGIDVALGAMAFEQNTLQRASLFDFASGQRLRTCSAEDLVVMKAVAGRDQDWLDVKGILIRQGAKLDWKTIVSELQPLCELKDAPEIVTELERLRKRVEKKQPAGP